VRGPGKHGEPGRWKAEEIAGDAATEQPEHLHRVLGTDDIGIPP
jgi:hypothetical protein